MSAPDADRLVIAVTSRALFDLTEADAVFRHQGVGAYRAYQRSRERDPLAPGAAFPLIRRLLAINRALEEERAVEVVLLSRNDPDTGLRVLHSIAAHGLEMRRALFTSGRDPFRFAQALESHLFLSSQGTDVRSAIECGVPAGHIRPTVCADDPADNELRIAFDFDGVLADDASEQVYQRRGLDAFHETERVHAGEPLAEGPLAGFCRRLSSLQRRLNSQGCTRTGGTLSICTAIVTSRGGPAHTRVVTTLRSWGVTVDAAFFLGGLAKAPVLAAFRPHIYFDDQLQHLVQLATPRWACAHVPFGIANDSVAGEGGWASRLH